MLAKLNPRFIKPGLVAIAILSIGLITFLVIGDETKPEQASQKPETTKKQKTAQSSKATKSATTSKTTKPVKRTTTSNKSTTTTSTKRKLVTVSRPGMKYRIVRVVEEPQIEPSDQLRKSSTASKPTRTDSSLAQN